MSLIYSCNLVELEKELGTVFYPVSKIITMNIRIPVVVRVGQEHLQVTTVSSKLYFRLIQAFRGAQHSQYNHLFIYSRSENKKSSSVLIRNSTMCIIYLISTRYTLFLLLKVLMTMVVVN